MDRNQRQSTAAELDAALNRANEAMQSLRGEGLTVTLCCHDGTWFAKVTEPSSAAAAGLELLRGGIGASESIIEKMDKA